MPVVYLAKGNFNSNIFDVYDKSLSIKSVLKIVYYKFEKKSQKGQVSLYRVI